MKLSLKSLLTRSSGKQRVIFMICIAGSFLAIGLPVSAGEEIQEEIPVVSFDEAMEKALSDNPNFKIMHERIEQSHYLISKAWAILLPNLDVNATLTHNDSAVSFSLPGDNDIPVEVEIQKQNAAFIGVNASIALFNARAYPLLKYAYNNLEYAELSANHFSNELLVAVAGAYYQVESAKNAVRVADDALKNADEFYRLSIGLSNVGNATRIDVLRAESEVLEAQNQVDTARDAVELARTGLAALIDFTGPFEISSSRKYEPVSTDLDELFEMAWNNRRDLDAARISVQLAERMRQDVMAQWFPNFDLRYGWQRTSNPGLSSDSDSWKIEVAARWSILDGGARRADQLQKASEIRVARSSMKSLELNIQKEVENNLLELRKSQRSLAATRKQISVVEETYRLVRRQFEVGMATSLDLQTAGKNLNVVRNRLVMEELNYALAALLLNKSAGAYLR